MCRAHPNCSRRHISNNLQTSYKELEEKSPPSCFLQLRHCLKNINTLDQATLQNPHLFSHHENRPRLPAIAINISIFCNLSFACKDLILGKTFLIFDIEVLSVVFYIDK